MQDSLTSSIKKYLDFLLIDNVSLAISFFLSLLISSRGYPIEADLKWIGMFFLVMVMNNLVLAYHHPYHGIYRRRYYDDLILYLMVTFYGALLVGFISYITGFGSRFPRYVVLNTFIIYYVLASSLKYLWKRLIYGGYITVNRGKPVPLLIFCHEAQTESILESIAATDIPLYEVVGICFKEGIGCNESVAGIPVLGGIAELVAYALEHHVPEVFIHVRPGEFSKTAFQTLIDHSVQIHLSIDSMLGFNTEVQGISDIGINHTLHISNYSPSFRQKLYSILKRFCDIIIGLVGCIVLIPFWIVIKAAYVIHGDFAPIIYNHVRIGLGGKPFRIYKFRSMVADADEVLQELLSNPTLKEQWQKNQKLDDDPRITPIGRFIRSTSIDELPQLFNVLIGNMSLIGPRPLIPGELEIHGGLPLYNKVKPGITGWWGCNGRSNIAYEERLELEYYYVKNYSFLTDVICFFRTILVVIKKVGAK